MALDDSGKLEKLKIQAYKKKDRRTAVGDSFEVMFNPASITVQHQHTYKTVPANGKSSQQQGYAHTRSQEIQLDLIIDGSGVLNAGLANLLKKPESVTDQINKFLGLCFYRDGEIHEPKYLKISWGNGPLKDFNTRLKSVDIEYTSFEPNGSPLRAVLKTSFIEDLDADRLAAQERSQSPDLTHTRIVRSGDTLPLLAQEIYGSAKYYLQLAKVNNLNNFRDLSPGMELIFPPLEK